MTRQRGQDGQSNLARLPTNRDPGSALDFQTGKPANDNNLDGVWPLFPFPDLRQARSHSEGITSTGTPIDDFPQALKRKTVSEIVKCAAGGARTLSSLTKADQIAASEISATHDA